MPSPFCIRAIVDINIIPFEGLDGGSPMLLDSGLPTGVKQLMNPISWATVLWEARACARSVILWANFTASRENFILQGLLAHHPFKLPNPLYSSRARPRHDSIIASHCFLSSFEMSSDDMSRVSAVSPRLSLSRLSCPFKDIWVNGWYSSGNVLAWCNIVHVHKGFASSALIRSSSAAYRRF